MSKVDGRVQPLVFDIATAFPFRVNLVPLVNLFDYDNKQDLFVNVVGNVAMFIPSGIVLPIIYKQLDTFIKVLLAGGGISLCIDTIYKKSKERMNLMEERLMAFIIWAIMGVLFIVMGIYDLNSKKAKPFGFWANAEVSSIEDVKGYNRALGKLWCIYGALFTLIGVPLLDGQNSGLIIIPVLGAMFISIVAMIVYVVSIEPKYRKKK